MPVSVVATGLVVEGPVPVLGKDARAVFVLDPFSGMPDAGLAHACEVLCFAGEGGTSGIRTLQCGDQVEVAGKLVMERVDGPFEDDLSAVRVRIEATRVSVLETEGE